MHYSILILLISSASKWAMAAPASAAVPHAQPKSALVRAAPLKTERNSAIENLVENGFKDSFKLQPESSIGEAVTKSSDYIPLIVFEAQNKSEAESAIQPKTKREPAALDTSLLLEDTSYTKEESTTEDHLLTGGGSLPTTTQADLEYPTVHLNSRDFSDTVFYIENTQVKLVPESNPTSGLPDSLLIPAASYEEDVIIDFPNANTSAASSEKFDLVLSPLANNNGYEESFMDLQPDFLLNDKSSTYAFESTTMPPSDTSGTIHPSSSSSSVPHSINRETPFGKVNLPNRFHFGKLIESIENHLLKNSLSIDAPKPLELSSNENVSGNQKQTNKMPVNSSLMSDPNTTASVENKSENSILSWMNDSQKLAVSVLLTLIASIILVVIIYGSHCLYTKYRELYDTGSGILGEPSTDGGLSKSHTISVDEVKSNSDPKIVSPQTTEQTKSNGAIPTCSPVPPAEEAAAAATVSNGSVITMTMKNNHLIIETEERSDISRDAHETKLHYSPSEKDDTFVVECARGAAILNSSTLNDNDTERESPKVNRKVVTNAKEAMPKSTSRTGLTSSDLSLNSSGDSNHYTYGNQMLYVLDDAPNTCLGSSIHKVTENFSQRQSSSEKDSSRESLDSSPNSSRPTQKNDATPTKVPGTGDITLAESN